MADFAGWVASKILTLIPWLEEKSLEYESNRTGYHHINNLNDRQRNVLIDICEEYERTGQPVPNDDIYNKYWLNTMREYGQPRPGRNEITDMLDDLEMRNFVDRTAETVTPTKKLFRHLRRTKQL